MKRSDAIRKLLAFLSLAFCFLLIGGSASAQIQGYVDSKNGDTFASWNNPTLNISGWAVAQEDGKPVASLQILIDNKVIGTVVPSGARPDIAGSLGNPYLISGWSFSYNAASNLQPGPHTLAIMAFDAEGVSAPLNFYSCTPNVSVTTPQPPTGSLDKLSSTTVAQNGSVVVTGWAGDPQDGARMKKVEILLDGVSVGNATLGGSRPDVQAVYPTYINAGWTFTYNPSKLSGQHTLTAIAYDNEGLSAPLSIYSQNTFNVLAPDLIETGVGIVGGSLGAGGTIKISDTVTNQGPGNAEVSYTRFYLNTTAVKGGSLFGSRAISALAAGASSASATITIALPLNLIGQYFVIACANDTNSNVESDSANNCSPSAAFSVGAADLVESGVAVVGGSRVAGGTIQISDTVTNQGPANAGVSYTRFYLNATAVKGGSLFGSRSISALAAGASSASAGVTLTLPLNLNGQYFVVACANDTNSDVESNSTNNCSVSASFSVGAADLVESGVAVVGGSQVAGGTIQISDTVTNQGSAAGVSYTRFYLNTTAVKGGSLFGSRSIGALAAGASSASAAITLSLPLNLNGQYFVVACANDTNSDVESNSANNCSASAAFSVAGADLVESGVAIVGGSQIAGGTIQISDTVTNQGQGNAGVSYTRFYLNTTAVKGGSLFGARTVSAIAAGVSSVSAGVTLTLPLNLTGQYFVVACANDTNSDVENDSANNCSASAALSLAGADLTITSVSTNPAAVLAGGTLVITDTTANALANAGNSWNRYYLSTSMNLVKTGLGAALVLGTRAVPALAASAISTGSVSLTIPASNVAGSYYLFSCANDTNSVIESNLKNNCKPSPVVVYATANTVFVDQSNVNASDASCGTSAIPCKTITEALAVAKAGQTVLVNSGTYTEQLNITQNVTLASVLKNAAVVQAPAVLVPDPDLQSSATSMGQQTALVNITGGATNVAVVNMGVRGPGPTSCGSIGYGVYVANANATIVGNQVLTVRDNPYGGCQNGVAIRFGSRAFGFVGHNGTIAYNTVMDYNKSGIVVDGDGTNVSVAGNFITGQNQTGINGQNGIQISRGALGLVDSNTVSYNRYGDTPLTQSAAGILIYDIVGGVTVTNNVVTGNDEGIGVYSDSTTATNVIIENNTVNKNAVLGIHVDALSSGNTIWMNTLQTNGMYDAADEHPDLTSNDWGTDAPSHNNAIGSGSAHPGSF